MIIIKDSELLGGGTGSAKACGLRLLQSAWRVKLWRLMRAKGDEDFIKVQETLQYVESAPKEMRRHQQMAHDVCRQGERLTSVVFTAGISTL